ncbi:MAE_28990/MAE_18760 family HEPN-like nuclease [uncultured Acinetobacter sp.]|uniref:MAE_28990/MAE_18760 family HEPN-like nuclease n=1 Tax=uncultured Acinetobacter sp. TaxID=165433 RepID=UPI00261E26A9|nr:MAE_28990/MAE_18760 family HEPN-like nuclease [uncultured Acinetobacter sp.]
MYYSNVVEKMNFKNSAPHIQEIFLLLANTKKMGLTYKKLSEFYSLYSGNLDSREARKVFKHYGINILKEEGGLKTIKDGRNKLAHGELTFEEYGRTLTIQQLKDLKEKVFIYFDSLLSQVKEYIERENYLEVNTAEE